MKNQDYLLFHLPAYSLGLATKSAWLIDFRIIFLRAVLARKINKDLAVNTDNYQKEYKDSYIEMNFPQKKGIEYSIQSNSRRTVIWR